MNVPRIEFHIFQHAYKTDLGNQAVAMETMHTWEHIERSRHEGKVTDRTLVLGFDK